MADPTIYWQSKLNVAEELAKFSLFLLSVPISEAAVERSFSRQTFLETPLRNGLEDKVVQAALFVKFNFLKFGDPLLIPEQLRAPVQYHH